MSIRQDRISVRNTRPEDFKAISELCEVVYADLQGWSEEQLSSHLRVFPEGQTVAVDTVQDRVVGMTASLIVSWDDYDRFDSWRDFTDGGMFTNHDPEGRTLYGAEVMVSPSLQRLGIGSKLYAARRQLVRDLGLARIRAGARLRGYSGYSDSMSISEYVDRVSRGEIHDPTLSFQLKRGFKILAVVPDYLRGDSESLGHAALIEWTNNQLPTGKTISSCRAKGTERL